MRRRRVRRSRKFKRSRWFTRFWLSRRVQEVQKVHGVQDEAEM